MTSGAHLFPDRDIGLESVRALDEAGDHAGALAGAWQALREAPEDGEAKRLAVGLLRRHPALAGAVWREEIARLVLDPAVEPISVARAGWLLLLAPGESLARAPDDPAALAARAEADALVLRLLEQTYVAVLEAETILTRLRRWLLLSDRWPEFPRLVRALEAQAGHNGGAWLLDPEEEARLDGIAGTPIASAYRPRRAAAVEAPQFADPVTEAVACQYRRWPYPVWSRVTAPPPKTLPALVEALDEGRPSGLPVAAEMLVAGCGTGREAALLALGFPEARVTAIDLSETSLAYAAERCGAAGLSGIDFRAMDLHDVADLGVAFDFIACGGVLHHLPDPEAGWTALAGALKPGGVMRVMVYSKVARLRIRRARAHVADLAGRPIDDDLLRETRRRLIDKAPDLVAGSIDFYTLGGVHDLLHHRHEDPFDVPRIVRALDALGLELLAFDLPAPFHRARYRRDHPHDPAFRDVGAWSALENEQPFLFRGMYKFWCRKPALNRPAAGDL